MARSLPFAAASLGTTLFACGGGAIGDDDEAEATDARLFSFAPMTDLHIGSGYDGFGDHNTFVFSHHPPVVTTLGILDCLTIDEVGRIDAMLRDGGYGGAVWGFFAGHHHVDYTLIGYEGQNIVVTPAEKDGGTVRVIQLYGDGRVEYGTFL